VKKSSCPPPIDIKAWKKQIEKVPFIHLLGMKLISFDEHGLVMEMKIVPKMINYLGVIHGGTLTSMIDTAVYFAIRPLIPKERELTTTEMKTNFFRAVAKGTLTARARVLHLGKRTAVGEAEIFDGQERLVAKGTVGHLIT